MKLDGEQKQIIKELIKGGRKYLGDFSPRERRKAINTAIAVGFTESRWHNLPGGDRDSQGWRQERAMYYRNPRNLKASIKRFFDEYRSDAPKGANLGDRAQAVQQSGTPDVWDGVAPMANQLRKRFSGSVGKKGSTFKNKRIVTVAGKKMNVTVPLSKERIKVDYTEAVLDNILSGAKRSLFDTVMNAGEAGSPYIKHIPAKNKQLTIQGQAQKKIKGGVAGGKGAIKGKGIVHKDQNKGAKSVAEYAARGVYGSGERTPSQNAATGGAPNSDHLTTKTDASAVDAKYGSGAMMARRLGIKGWKKGTYDRHTINIGGRKYSVQILEDVEGHYDHTHIGVQRIG